MINLNRIRNKRRPGFRSVGSFVFCIYYSTCLNEILKNHDDASHSMYVRRVYTYDIHEEPPPPPPPSPNFDSGSLHISSKLITDRFKRYSVKPFNYDLTTGSVSTGNWFVTMWKKQIEIYDTRRIRLVALWFEFDSSPVRLCTYYFWLKKCSRMLVGHVS